MSNPIRSYQDMVDEKKHLEELMKAQKQLIMYDIQDLKQELKPVGSALSFLGKVTTKESGNNIVAGGTNKLIDLVVRKLILARAGWITKAIVPFIVKNYSSHFIADHKDDMIKKVVTWFGNRRNKKKAAQQNGQIADVHQ